MKYFIVILLLLVAFFIVFFPLVNTERVCYETSQTQLDIISSNVFNQRLTKNMECSQRMDVLFNLESCMQDATKSSIVALYANDQIQRMVAIIRPYSKNLWTLKSDHNDACTDFPWYQLP